MKKKWVDREQEYQQDVDFLMNWQAAYLRPYFSSSLVHKIKNSSNHGGDEDDEEIDFDGRLGSKKVENFLMNKSVAEGLLI
jgi:hypothetical protein